MHFRPLLFPFTPSHCQMCAAAIPKRAASLLVCANVKASTDYAVLLLKRAAKSRFMPNSFVFPGGLVEPSDNSHAVTAVRETFEEAGLLLADHRPPRRGHVVVKPDQDRVDHWRKEVAENAEKFSLACTELLKDELLAREGLIPWARYVTPESLKFRYDADFFLTVADEVPPNTVHCDVETIDSTWQTPRDALELHDAGKIVLPHVTWYMLKELLVRYPTTAQLSERVLDSKPRDMTPVMPFMTKTQTLLLPGDEEYPHARGAAGARHRVVADFSKGDNVLRLKLDKS